MVSKKLYLVLALVLVMIIPLAFGSAVMAAKDRVVDQADILTSAQETELEKSAADLGVKYNMDVVIVTVDSTGGKTAAAYADDYFDFNGYGVGDNFNGVLLLISFDPREVYISTTGSAIDALSDADIESIQDAMSNAGISEGQYFAACQVFLTDADNLMAPNSLSTADGIAGLLGSGGIGGGIYGSVKKRYKGKNTLPIFEYQKNSLVSMGIVQDNLFNTYTTSRIIPRTTGTGGVGGGGSSTHTSSSGRTHGGGGRGF